MTTNAGALASRAPHSALCERIVNVFETGAPEGDYGAIVVRSDGPGRTKQIHYGRLQAAEFKDLYDLVDCYVLIGRGEALRPYVNKIGIVPLADDAEFKRLLREASNDQSMRFAQDALFRRRYLYPAKGWAEKNGFVLPLSFLVIYDSFVQSGLVPYFLRRRFLERPPSKGGDEKRWIKEYVNARHLWLLSSSNPILRKTVYRTECFKREIDGENWILDKLPINANGVLVQ